MKIFIVTGASRGLGEAITKKLMKEDHYLICVSRSENTSLIQEAKEKKIKLSYINFDLNDLSKINHLVDDIMLNIKLINPESICLINNAGVLAPIKPIGSCDSQEIIQNININTISPMVLTNELMKRTENINIDKLIINISSGAGKNPYHGWASYCSSKAAIDMFTKCVGLEQSEENHSLKIISFSPGIIDTNMQQQIRSTKQEDFKLVERFKQFKEESLLQSPDFVAEKVLEVINNKDLKTGQLVDIKQMI